MAGPPEVGFAQLTCNWVGSPLPFGAVTTHGFTYPGTSASVFDTAVEEFGTALAACTTSGITLSQIDIKVGPVATGPTRTITVGQAGSFGAPPVPPNTAILVTVPAILTSGRFAGRFFIPGPSESGVTDGGGLDPGYRSTLQGFVDDAYEIMSLAGVSPVIFRVDEGAPRNADNPLVRGRVASQRRRNRR